MKYTIPIIILIITLYSCQMKNSSKQVDLPKIDSLWNFSDPAATEKKFRAILQEAKASENKEYYGELLTQLARTYSLRSEFDESHKILDSVATILEKENMPIVKTRYLLERGRTYNSAKQKEKAISLFKEAFKLAGNINADFYEIDAAHMLGIAEQPEKQLEWNLKAMDLAEKTNDQRAKKWLGPLYNNIGWTYHDMRSYAEAMRYFEKSLDWRESNNDERGVFIAKWCIARNYRAMDNIETALKIQGDLLAEIEADSSKTDGYVYEELAECHLIQKDSILASKYFKLAYDVLSNDKWMQNNEAERLERMKRLSESR